jgi:sulfatase maturation enzyme AslB (radical SAM superfamily)
LTTTRLQEVLEEYQNLEVIQFCGTYGDTIAASNVLEQITLAKNYAKKIQIHTHGGIRNTEWWHNFAVLLSDIEHDVWFALDGLKGVHEIYRQGTNFDKTIANAQAFINAGGYATWQFIPWAHNEHQIMQCIKMSQDLKFKKFKFVKSVRKQFQGRHWQTGEPIEFKAWKNDYSFNTYETIPIRNQVLKKDCRHLSDPSLYLNATGNISVCCWFNNYRQSAEFELLPDIESELSVAPLQTCLQSCGSYAIIDNI